MTDEEKIRYLIKCANSETIALAVWRKPKEKCEKITLGDVAAIITHQQAEIERLKKELAAKITENSLLEREKAETISCFVDDLQTVRADATKEFAERFKDSLKGYGGLYCRATMNARVDNLVKEMVGVPK